MQDFHLATNISMFINFFYFLKAAEYCIVLILATGETIMVCEVADNGNELYWMLADILFHSMLQQHYSVRQLAS